MDENIFDKDGFDAIKDVDLKQTMETSYIDYAMSVIACPCTAGCKRWYETGSEAYFICYDRIEQRTGQATS